jgi:hypothetical protein
MRPAAIALILALASVAPGQPAQGCRYLIICPDQFTAAVQPLAEWRTLTGNPAGIAPLSATGTEPESVRQFIRDAWQNWPVRPEYILIAASADFLPGYQYYDDCYYGDVQGDWRMEIPVGRLPAVSGSECAAMVAKVLAYERRPSMSDTLWHWQGTTVVSDDSQGGGPDPFYLTDSRYARQLWLNAGYVVAESLYNLAGDSTRELVAALNDGRSFITYRGVAGAIWWNPFNTFWPDTSWRNHARLPIIVAGTCATVTLAPGELMLGNATLRFCTQDSLGGAVAYFGTTLSGFIISMYRSVAFRGFFNALFNRGVSELGQATLAARAAVDTAFADHDRYVEWSLLGDPAMTVRTAPPRRLTVVCDSVIPMQVRPFPVQVLTDGSPVSGAVVCAQMDSSVYAVDTTGPAGTCTLDLSPVWPGMMNLTVTGANLAPFEGLVRVECQAGAYVSHLRHLVVDDPPSGDGDSCAAPGETISLPTWVVNRGDSLAQSVTARLRSLDPHATVIESSASLGSVAPGESAFTGSPGFRVAVSPECPDGRELAFILSCASGAAVWNSDERVTVGPPRIAVEQTLIIETQGNGNGILDPNEQGVLLVLLTNSGWGAARGVSLTVRSYDRRLAVPDSVSAYGNIPGLGSAGNGSDVVTLVADSMLPETQVSCSLFVSALGHSWAFPLTITVGVLTTTDPQPDGPAWPPTYYAYEDEDSAWPEHPDPGFVEIHGLGTRLSLADNQTVTIDLPQGFGRFRYYGRDCSQLSICSNGWLAPGPTTYSGWSNRSLPYANGVPLIAPNWDDLYPPRGGAVWYWHDSVGHRFIVEWDSIHYRTPIDSFETFECVIWDSTLAAADGSNEFCFGYAGFHSIRRSTVGIQDSAGLVGITVLYDTTYHRAASPLGPGHTIKFTTDAPIVGLADAAANRPAAARLAVSPSPCRGRLQVHTDSPPDQRASLRLYSAAGVLVREFDIRHRFFDISSLASGAYFLRLSCPSATATARIILTR